MFCSDTTHSAKAVEFLRVQHRRLIQLFVDYFAARSESRRHDLRPILCHDVKVHLTLEADCFLPSLSLAVGDKSICAAAAKERQLIESLIDEVEYPDPGAYGISEQVHVLSGLVHKHVLTAEKPAGLFERAALSNLDDAGTPGERVSDCNLFSSLSQALHVYLNRLRQSWDNKIPFVGQTISPTARGCFSVEAPPHKAEYIRRFCICVQIQIATKIRPMIQRLDHSNVIACRFESVADCPQYRDRILDARTLSRDRGCRPFRANEVAGFVRDLAKGFQSAHHDVIGVSERKYIVKFFAANFPDVEICITKSWRN